MNTVAFDTITKVYPKNDAASKPGTVYFQGGQKFSTFSDAILSTAKGLEGQLVEYTTETKGKYTNLSGVKAAAKVSQQFQTPTLSPVVPVAPSETPALVAAIKDVASAMREMAAEYRKVAAGILSGPTAASPGASGLGTPAVTATDSAAATVDEAQKKLAAVVGEDAAEAMFAAIKKRHGKKPEALAAAAAELLKAHNLSEAA